MLSVHKCAVEKNLKSMNGYLDLFLRFLMGLSLESNHSLLKGLLVKKTDSSLEREKTTEYLKQKIKTILCSEMALVLFHCLNELKDHSLTTEIQNYLTSGKLNSEALSPDLWSALVYILMTSNEKFEEFELRKYGRSDAAVFWLLPVIKVLKKIWLHDCNITKRGCVKLCMVLSSLSNVREVDLSNNSLQDAGVEILSAGVKNSCYAPKLIEEWFSNHQNEQDNQLKYEAFLCITAGLQDTECRLESLNLKNCGVTEAGCVYLSKALSLNPSHLRVLDLSWNNIGDSGVKHLCAAVVKVHCALETLKLNNCNITHKSCIALTKILQTASNLKELSLSENELQNSGVMLFSVGLHHPHCTLETLRLSCCNIETEGFGSLASVLRSNSHLRELDLGNNRPGDQGAELLSAVLQHPNCRLKTLRLKKCGMTERSCTALASALSSKTCSLTDLDLSINDLQDSGVKKLCAGLQNPHCTLEKLRLSNCNVTHEGVTALTEALKSHPSPLKELDLLENDLEESGLNMLTIILEKTL